MIGKTFLAATLALTLGCFVLTPPAAEAGGGMGFGSGTSTCRLVLNAPNQPQTVTITDGFVSGDIVKVGALALLCDLPAIGGTEAGPPTGTPITEAQRTAVACYLVSGADATRIATTVMDPFTTALSSTATQGVTLGAIQFLCVPAATTNP